MGVVRNVIKGLDMIMVDMLEVEVVVDQKETARRTAEMRDIVEQRWLQRELENELDNATGQMEKDHNSVSADKLEDKTC